MVENINDLKLDSHTNHVLIAIKKIVHSLDWKNLDRILQISSVSDFEKTPISQVFLKLYSQNLNLVHRNCLLTQDF